MGAQTLAVGMGDTVPVPAVPLCEHNHVQSTFCVWNILQDGEVRWLQGLGGKTCKGKSDG